MDIFVATYQDNSGAGKQKVFKKKEDADRLLFRMFDKEIFEFYDKTGIAGYIEYKNYGYWNARVKKYKI